MPLTNGKCARVYRDAWKLWIKDGWHLIVYALVPIVYGVVVAVSWDDVARFAPSLGVARILTLAVLPFMYCILGAAILRRCPFGRCVRAVLRDHGYDVCLDCGYWMRDLRDDVKRCPECGAAQDVEFESESR